MRLNYKKLGPYIRQIDIRNSAGKEENLLGVSTRKVFIESIANTVGTDFTKYKIVKRNQFTYVPDTSRRGDKIGIAMLESHDEALVSQAYSVFEIIDSSELDPEYLMMWFRRPEFDRYARFKSHGSVREIFDWDEMSSVELPIPHINKQREFVREYNTIVNSIKLNEQLNQNLEDTAKALYRQWFLDFEFPISREYAELIGKSELEGKTYKSSGGEFFLDEIEGVELPLGWRSGNWNDLVIQFSGYSFKGEQYAFDEGISVVRGENVTEQKLRWDTHKKWNLELPGRADQCFLNELDIVIGMDGSKVGKNWAVINKFQLPLLIAQRVSCIRAKNIEWQPFLYYSLFINRFFEYVQKVHTGTSVPHISGDQILQFPILIPEESILSKFCELSRPLLYKKLLNNQQIEKYKDVLQILLVRAGAGVLAETELEN